MSPKKTKGKIVYTVNICKSFINCVLIYPYRIDRTLNQLLLNNAFERCAGVVFGKFSSSGNPDEIMTVLKDFTSKVKVPVYYGLEYGHELPFVSLRSDKIITVHQ